MKLHENGDKPSRLIRFKEKILKDAKALHFDEKIRKDKIFRKKNIFLMQFKEKLSKNAKTQNFNGKSRKNKIFQEHDQKSSIYAKVSACGAPWPVAGRWQAGGGRWRGRWQAGGRPAAAGGAPFVTIFHKTRAF